MAEPTIVLFGNPNPQMQVKVRHDDGSESQVSVPAAHLKQTVTRVEMREDFDDAEIVDLTLSTDNDRMLTLIARMVPEEFRKYTLGVYECEQIVGVHHAGSPPDWVSSTDPEFAKALADYFRCPLGEPVALITNAGRDAMHSQILGTAAQPAAFNYGAISANTGAGFATGDTTLAGEIATGGGGLLRAQMTFAHSAGTNTSTLTRTWTANGSDALPVTVKTWANFNAASVGTVYAEEILSAASTLTTSGDSLTVTFTLTA